jgi:hypothetical protein
VRPPIGALARRLSTVVSIGLVAGIGMSIAPAGVAAQSAGQEGSTPDATDPDAAEADEDASLGDPVPQAEVAASEDATPVDGVDDRARVHFEAGRNHYDSGRYEAAVSEFEAALALSPRPQLRYNLALAYERTGQLDESVAQLELYMSEAALSPDDRATIEARIDSLRARAQEVGSPSPAPVASSSMSGALAGAITSFSIAGAGAVLFGIFAALSEVEDQHLADSCAGACSDDAVSTLGTYNVVADIGLGVAAVGALTGLVFLVLELTRPDASSPDPSSADPSSAPPVQAWLSPTSVGATGQVAF